MCQDRAVNAQLERHMPTGDRVKVRTASAVDSSIDQVRLRVGRLLTRIQTRMRKVQSETLPEPDPAHTAYYREMMMVEHRKVPSDVAQRIEEIRRDGASVRA